MTLRHSCFFLASLASLAVTAQAQSTWNLATGGSWNTVDNWTGGIPNADTAIAAFVQDFGAAPVITLDNAAGFTVNRISCDDTGATGDPTLEISPGTGGSLILAGPTPTIQVAASDPLTSSLTINAVLDGAAVLTKTGAGMLRLGATNTYSGGTVLSSGTVQWAAAGALGTGAITVGDAGSGADPVTLLGTTAATTLTNNIIVSSLGTGTVTLGGGQTSGAVFYSGLVTLNRPVTLTSPTGVDRTDFSGDITGNVGTLTIAGGHRTIFTGTAKTFTGDISITGTGSNLQVGVASTGALSQIPNASSVTVGPGAVLRLSGLSEEFGGLNGSGTVNSNAAPSGGVFIIGSRNANGSFSGPIGSGGTGLGITKTGTGTLTLSGSGTYTGRTSVNGGTLTLAFGTVSSNIIGSASPLTMGNGTLNLTGPGTQTVGGLTTTANTTGRIILEANQTLTLGALTSAGAASALNLNTIAGGANGSTAGTGIILLTGQTPGTSIRPGFTVTDAGGTGLATVNASGQVIRLSGSALLPASAADAAVDYQIDSNGGGAAAAGSSTLLLTASAAARSIAVAPGSADGVLTLDPSVMLSNNSWFFGGTGPYQITGSTTGAGLVPVAPGDAMVFANHQGGDVTIASPILANGTNAVNFNGPGTTVLSALSTYTGGTFVSGGTLNLNIGGGTGAIRNGLTINSGATVRVSVATGLGSNQNFRVTNTTINGGTLDIQNTGNNSITSATITMTGGTLTGMTGSKFDLRNNGAGNTNVTSNASSVTSVINVGTLGLPFNAATFNVAQGITPSGFDLLISSIIVNNAGTGGGGTAVTTLTKTGAGTLRLTGNNTFTGDTNANAGTLSLAHQNALALSAVNLNGGSVVFDSSVTGNAFTFGGLKGSGNLTLANNATPPAAVALTAGTNGTEALYSGTLTGTGGSFIKNGTGILTLTGTNTFTGTCGIAAGTLRVNSNTAIGTNAALVGNGTAAGSVFASVDATPLTFAKSVSTNTAGGGITFGDATGTGDLTFTGNLARATGATPRTVNVAGSTTVTFNGNLTSPGSNATTTFTKGGTGTLIIRGTGSTGDPGFSNVVMANGILAVTRLANLGTASSLGMATGATAGAVSLTLDGGELHYIDGGAAASNTNRLLQIGRTTDDVSGTIRNNAAETLTFSNPDPIAFGTVDQSRSLFLGGSNPGNNTLAQVISDNGIAAVSVTKQDAGTWVLTGANTYTGGTTVSAGKLSLTSATLADTSSVRLTTGATLDLPHGQADTIATLWINGVQQSPGAYTAANKPGLISGTGSLLVTTGPPPGSAFATWLTDAGLTPGNPGTAANESYEGSGVANIVQFALGGDVLDPAKNGIQQVFNRDAANAANLVITIAARTGATFTGTPSPTASLDGVTYTIQGSTTLGTWTVPVEEVAVQNDGGLLTAPAGYLLKSFRLVQSPALSSLGFLRIQISQP